MQDYLLDRMAESAAEQSGRLLFGISSLTWDSTEQRLAMPCKRRLWTTQYRRVKKKAKDSSSQLTQIVPRKGGFLARMKKGCSRDRKTKVLVSLQNISVVCQKNSSFAAYTRRLVRPIVEMPCGRAEVQYHAHFESPVFAALNRCESALKQVVCMYHHHFDRDGDSTNDKTVFMKAMDILENDNCSGVTTMSDMTCGNHRVALCDTSIMEVFGFSRCINSTYRYALLMRMSSYWHRCCASLPQSMRSIASPCTTLVMVHPFNRELC